MLMMSLPTSDPTPPTEVPEKARRRTFTAEYKRRILRKADACKKPGDVTALLRREGLYSSHLTEWRRARERGDLAGKTRPRGPTPRPAPDARDRRISDLERENAKLEKRARRAEAMVALQKKVALLMETLADDEPGEKP
jgi:transposase-like protein